MAVAAGEANQPNRGIFGKAHVLKTHKPTKGAVGQPKSGGGRHTQLHFS